MNPDEAQLRLMQLIQTEPTISQRQMAERLGLSLGKTNYCLRALMDRGWVKARNFKNSRNKLGYAYRLTPNGVQERIRATVGLLERKSREYDLLRGEIDSLRAELNALPDRLNETADTDR